MSNRGPRRRLQHCRRNGSPRSYQPTPADNKTTARGGSPGSRVVARVRLPRAQAPVAKMNVRSPVTVAGAAAELHRVPIQCFATPSAWAGMIPDMNGASILGTAPGAHRSVGRARTARRDRKPLSALNQRLRGDAAVEVGPHMLREIVQLAAAHRVPVVAPGEDFGIQPLIESGGEPGLGLFEPV